MPCACQSTRRRTAKSVPQIVDARSIVSAAIDPAQALTQFDEDAMDLPVSRRLARPLTARADEERYLRSSAHTAGSQPSVVFQGIHRARMQGQLARLGELGLSHGQCAGRQVDIGVEQGQRLGHRRPAEAIQTEQRSKVAGRRLPCGRNSRAAASRSTISSSR